MALEKTASLSPAEAAEAHDMAGVDLEDHHRTMTATARVIRRSGDRGEYPPKDEFVLCF